MTASDIIKAIETVAPPRFAYGDDPTGFQVGDQTARVDRVLFCLEITESVVAEAVEGGVEMIVAHHPLIFRPIKRLAAGDPLAKLLISLIKRDISVYSAHTNLDRAPWGVSDALAEALGLKEIRALASATDLNMFKLAVFTPEEAVGAVIEAIAGGGGGVIGEYTHCSFRSPGTGTFKPGAGAHPVVGDVGVFNEVQETRVEAVVPSNLVGAVVSKVVEAHPYEEVAYDLYRLENHEPGVGFGRIGILEEEATLGSCLERWEKVLQAPLRSTGDRSVRVKMVAVCGGSGGEFISMAASKADVFVTGDIKHHAALDAMAAGIPLVDAGHYATERLVIPGFAARVEAALSGMGKAIQVIISKINTDPWRNE
ncbi:MAG: Nif3-like dinuclear metal center hexameric protein [Candidatus Aquicultorales bacterium]